MTGTKSMKTVIYPVRDLERAKAVYTALLGAPTTDQPYYVGYEVGGQQLGLLPNGHDQGMAGPVSYWHVDDIEMRVKALVEAGGRVTQEVRDVGGGKLIASVDDADGNVIGLLQPPR